MATFRFSSSSHWPNQSLYRRNNLHNNVYPLIRDTPVLQTFQQDNTRTNTAREMLTLTLRWAAVRWTNVSNIQDLRHALAAEWENSPQNYILSRLPRSMRRRIRNKIKAEAGTITMLCASAIQKTGLLIKSETEIYRKSLTSFAFPKNLDDICMGTVQNLIHIIVITSVLFENWSEPKMGIFIALSIIYLIHFDWWKKKPTKKKQSKIVGIKEKI